MTNSVGRIFKVIQHTGTDTISEFISLTVKSTNPLQLTDGDKLLLTSEFLVFSDYIDTTKIQVGDKFKAQSYNSGQTYYISEIIESSNDIDLYHIAITDLQSRVDYLERQVASLQTDMHNTQLNIGEINSAIDSLDNRVTELESKI